MCKDDIYDEVIARFHYLFNSDNWPSTCNAIHTDDNGVQFIALAANVGIEASVAAVLYQACRIIADNPPGWM